MNDPKIIYLAVTNSLTYDQRMSRICSTLHESGYRVNLIGINRTTPLPDRPYRQIRLTSWFPKGKLFYLENHIRLFFYLLFRRADLLVANDLDTALPIWMVSKLRTIPRLMDAHEYFTEMKEVLSRPTVHRLWSALARFLIPKFPDGYTVGPELVNKFRAAYGVDYGLIRNMPRLRQWKERTENEQPFLLYQGAVNQGRGFETLIPAMHHINYPLVICGDGNYMEELKTLIAREQLADRIQLTGMLQPDELRKWTDRAAIAIVIPDKKGANQFLALPNKFFDCIEAGLPQITCNYPEYETINKKYPVAVLLDVVSPLTVAQAVNELMEDAAKRKAMQAACRQARQEFCWDQEEAVLLSIYKRKLPQ